MIIPTCTCHEGAHKGNWIEDLDCPFHHPKHGTSNDPVNHPSHYTFGRFEVIDVLQDWFPTNPLLWQIVKYVARAQHKGNMLQDLKKAQFYLNKAIEQLEVDLSKEKI